MKKIIFSLIFALLLINVVGASFTSLGTFKTNSNITIRQLCSNCTYNNITSIIYSNGTDTGLPVVTMAKAGTEYTHSFTSTSLIGTYTVNGVGDPDGLDTIWGYTFEVNSSGAKQTSIFNNPILLIFILLSVILLTLAFVFNNASIGFLAGILFMLGGMYTMIYGFNNVTDLYTRGIAGVIIGLGLIVSISAAYEQLTD